MTNKEIRESVMAYRVASKVFLCDGIPLKVSKLAKALKIANRIISVKCLEIWVEEYKPYLYSTEWSPSKLKHSEKKHELLLYPHEFLILCAQGKNYLETLRTVLEDVKANKFAHKNTSATLRQTEVNGFGKFVQNQVRDRIDAELPEREKIKCVDVEKLKKLRRKNYTDFKILEEWHEEIVSPLRVIGAPLKLEEIAYEETEKNKTLGMRHVIGKEGANKKKELDNKREIMKSLYSLRGVKPPFITNLEYFEIDSKSPSMHKIVPPSNISSLELQPIQKKVVVKNFVKKNKELMEYHSINKRRILMLEKQRPPATACNTARKLSHCSTATSRDALFNKMNSIFEEEVRKVERKSSPQSQFSFGNAC
eukprot:TRINITY_DN11130_c0_g1_i8.p1 TRINITY_DN11130_c0_g1~~TRINITY_DN11130_c0_g1_i8.p1  ORF type:complete len:366 (+),score=119.44 TRINITY_DN11130_c0_g1_i8:486-1583(+)